MQGRVVDRNSAQSKFLRKHERRRRRRRRRRQASEQDSRSTAPRAKLCRVSAHIAAALIVLIVAYTDGLASGQYLSQAGTTTPRRPNVIVLEDGAITPVVSLDDFLMTQSQEDELPGTSAAPKRFLVETTTANNGEPHQIADHREIEKISPHKQPASNSSSTITGKSAQLAIVFTLADKDSRHRDKNETTTSGGHERNEHAAGETSGHGESKHGVATSGANQTGGANKPIPQHWQVRSLLNVTHDYPLAYSQIICGYVWPLMAALTLFTNLMIVFVLTQSDMRTPTNVVLTAIAIADIIPIVVPVPWFVYLFAMGNEKQVLYPPIACYFYQHSTRSISEIFYFLSTWLNVLLAIQDYLAACQPKLAQKYCQIRVVVLEIVLLTLLAFLLNLPQALKLVFKPVKFYYQGELTWGCKALQAKWFKDLVGEYVALYDDIFTAIIVVFVDGGPAVLLITLTSLLIRQLQRQRIKGHLLMEQARTASKRRRERHRQQEYESSARVMIFVLLAFLAVKIPFATTYTLMIIQSRFEIHFVENLVDFQKAITLTDLVFVLSYPINFTIFCCCSKKFRHKCAQLLGECNQSTKLTRDRIMSSFPNSLNSDSFLSRRYSSSLAGAGARLHRESSVSFILPDEELAAAAAAAAGGGPNGNLQQRIKSTAAALGKDAAKVSKMKAHRERRARNFSMPDLISKSSASMSSASTAVPKSRHSEETTLSPASSYESDGAGDGAGGGEVQQAAPAAPSMRSMATQHQQQIQRCEGQRHFFAPEQQSQSFEAGSESMVVEAEGIHTQAQPPPLMPSGQEFRRLLGEGSLCLECIMCYERLKRSSGDQQMAAAHQQNQVEAVAYDGACRRSSGQGSDSSQFSWPPVPPPQPRSLETLRQQLHAAATRTSGVPQIITTTCESISEQHSQSSEGAGDGVAVADEHAAPEMERARPERMGKSVGVDSTQHGQLARQLHMVSHESDLSQMTTGTMGEINTPDWSQVSAGGRQEAAGVSPAAGMSFGEVGQFQWEARRRMELAAAALDAAAHSQQHGQSDSSCLSRAGSGGDGPALGASRKSNSQSGEMMQSGENEFSRSGEQAKRRMRSRSRDNNSGDLGGSFPSQSYLAGPQESRARAGARASVSTEMAGSVHDDDDEDEHRRERRRFTKTRAGQHETGGQDSGESQDERSFQGQEERMTLSEQATTKPTGDEPTGKLEHRPASQGGRLSLSSKFDSRQRSLSLSNSNLSTLPNATGMLADVLVSVLFVGQDKRQGQGDGGSASKPANKSGKKSKHKDKRG